MSLSQVAGCGLDATWWRSFLRNLLSVRHCPWFPHANGSRCAPPIPRFLAMELSHFPPVLMFPSHLPGLHRFLPLSAPTGRVESSGSAVHVVTPCRRLPTPWWCGHDALTSDLSSARRSVCMGSKEQMQMRACGHPPRCPHFFPSGLPSL